jgi:O-antigen/teichoic acid export membrane protein
VGVVPLAFVAGVAVSAVAMAAAARRTGVRLTLAFDWPAARDLFTRSGQLVVSAFLGLVIFNFDLIFLRYVRGAEAAGYYHAGYTFLAFAVNVLIAYGHSVMPTFARPDLPMADKRAVYHTTIANAFAFTLPVAVGGCLLAPGLIALVYGAEYAPAAAVLAWLVWVIPIAGARESAVAALLASNGERAFLRSNVITVVCNVALVLTLVPWYGLLGAAAATVATEAVRLVVIAWCAVQLDYARLAVARVLKPLAAAAVMAPVVWWLAPRGLAVAIPAGAVVYGVVLLAVRGARFQRGRLVELTV